MMLGLKIVAVALALTSASALPSSADPVRFRPDELRGILLGETAYRVLQPNQSLPAQCLILRTVTCADRPPRAAVEREVWAAAAGTAGWSVLEDKEAFHHETNGRKRTRLHSSHLG